MGKRHEKHMKLEKYIILSLERIGAGLTWTVFDTF